MKHEYIQEEEVAEHDNGHMHKIVSDQYRSQKPFGISKAVSYTHLPIAYLYTYDYQTKDSAIKVFDLNAGTIIRDNFITDGTAIDVYKRKDK